MPVNYRCKCGRWGRVPAGTRNTRCPECLRTIRLPNRGLIWCVIGGVFTLLVGVGVLAAALPRSPEPVVQATEPTPNPPPATEPVTVKRTEPSVAAKPPDPPPPTTRPAPAAPVARPVPQFPEPPRVGKLVTEPAGRYKVGDTFGQDVTVTRASAFGILGIVTSQGAEYSLTSRCEVTAVNADGSITVTQTVQAGKLLDASADMKEPLTDALKKAVGAKVEMAIAQNGKVTALKGLDDPLQLKVGRDAERQTLRLWSVLDADAWKELAGLTFFQPDKPGVDTKWTRDFAHDWGPLGSWLGRTDYQTAKKPDKDGTHKVGYVHAISHRPAKGGGNLPVAFTNVSFPSVQAGGAIKYDPKVNRVTTAEELFHVRGGVTAAFGGADATVEVEEKQLFRLAVSEVVPRQLVGEKPK
jgi:hypothetical protein